MLINKISIREIKPGRSYCIILREAVPVKHLLDLTQHLEEKFPSNKFLIIADNGEVELLPGLFTQVGGYLKGLLNATIHRYIFVRRVPGGRC